MLAISLAQQGLTAAVIDREDPEGLVELQAEGRTTAVSYGSKLIFDQLGIWDRLGPMAEPILQIRVFEHDHSSKSAQTPWVVYYDHKDLGAHPMGYIIENRLIRQAIYQRACEMPENLAWLAPAEVGRMERKAEGVEVHLANGEVVEAALLVGAEGRLSPTREEAGLKVRRWDYNQIALVAHVFHEKPHEGSAWEIFQPQGPFAILPLKNCAATGACRSGIVWTGSPLYIENLLAMDNEGLSAELERIFPWFGPIRVGGRRWSYPLSALVAQKCTGHRLVIVGDAAHTVHPVAGQGVNLGWRDGQTLATLLAKSKRLGLDLGSQSVLTEYQRYRRLDTLSVLAMTDGVVRLFSSRSSLLYFLRNAGLGMVNQLPFFKRRLMRHAMGI